MRNPILTCRMTNESSCTGNKDSKCGSEPGTGTPICRLFVPYSYADDVLFVKKDGSKQDASPLPEGRKEKLKTT